MLRRVLMQYAIPFTLAGLVINSVGCSTAQVNSNAQEDFFAYVDTGKDLPEDKIYPQGRIFPYMGYSGKHEEDAANGFTAAGHHYGLMTQQKDKLAAAKEAGLPYLFGVGMQGRFVHDPPLQFTEEQLKDTVRQQVLEVVDDPYVLWWYLLPEEMRFWRAEEMDYMRIATETIREHDPHGRPIIMYEPNNRTTKSLVKTGAYQDIIAKGCYVNAVGHQDSRIWIRWSMEQEMVACEQLEKQDGRLRTPLMMPQMSRDQEDPALDSMVRAWARHDVYLGMMTGAKGVLIWSLFPRQQLMRSHKIHYDAFSEAGMELTRELNLGKVFLFGEEKADLTVQQTEGIREVELYIGPKNKIEENTTSDEERERYLKAYPALTTREISYAGRRYLFLCNSSTEPMVCEVEGLPRYAKVERLFVGKGEESSGVPLCVRLAPWEVECLRLSPPAE